MYELSPKPRADYSVVLSAAFRLFWHHRSLWIGGMLAMLFGGGLNFNFNTGYQQNFRVPQPGEPPDFGAMFEGTWIANFIENPTPYLLIGLVIALFFALIYLIFGTWAQAALIAMTDEADRTGQTALSSGWGQARTRLRALIGANFLISLPVIVVYLLFLITFLPGWLRFMRVLMENSQNIEAVQQTIPTFMASMFLVFPIMCCIGIPTFLVTTLLRIYALRVCQIEQIGALASIRRAWQLVRQQLGLTLINGVVVLIVTWLVGFVISVPFLFYWLGQMPTFFANGTVNFPNQQFLLWSVAMWLTNIIIGGIVASFTSTLWTKLYKAFVAVEVDRGS